MQVNFVDQDVLRDAQRHPERHRSIIVRVAGFPEYFTSLDRNLQDEIISRTAPPV
jgi:formate C-acetyltransferase